MKRIIKNTINISIIVLALGSIIATSTLAINSNSGTSNNAQTDQIQAGQPTSPNSSDNNSQTPPSMPNSNGTSDSNTPPDKPDGSDSSDSSTPPAKPEENSNSDSSNSNGSQPGASNDANPQASNIPEQNNPNSNSSTINAGYYIAIGAESIITALALLYLIMSHCNQKSFKETFKNSDKVLIYILSSIIVTAAATISTSAVINAIITAKTSTSTEQTTSNKQENNTATPSYSAATSITESTEISNQTYDSATADENALSVSGDINVTASDITVTKTGDSDGGDNTSFYGTNSAIIAKDGANLTLKNANVTTDATGANAVFSYGGSATTNNSTSDGTTINISDSTITTSKDNSGGIMVTGGGTLNATNLTVTTAGTSSASIRSDRGGGTMSINGGTYKTTGQGSPTIYSTADITVKNAALTATASEGVVIEGKNSVTLENTTLTDSNTKLNGQSTTYKNIFLYQSMSGDADDGTSEFTAKDSSIITNNGDSFYITNTTAKISLTNNKIVNNDSEGSFLRIKADSWGTSGSNGGIVTLVLNNQTASGNIVVDSISTLDMTLKSSSSYTGTINGAKSAKSIKLTLDKTSKLTLTNDSYVTSLDDADSSYSNINFNGHKLYVNGTAIN